MSVRTVLLIVSIVCICSLVPAFAQAPAPQHSRISSPVRPQGVVSAPPDPAKAYRVISGVPAYTWRHGCGPTSVGMVVGYWDGKGFELIPGDASIETPAALQVVASGGDFLFTNPVQDLPWAPGNEHHYEDYARPVDMNPPVITDAYITAGRTPHQDDCLADYMGTSRSEDDMAYGWSWSSGIEPAFVSYVTSQSEFYQAATSDYYIDETGDAALTFNVLKNEIDSNRPMVFLVDSDGDGYTDHFVTVVGYDDSNPANLQYLFHDTWDYEVHAATFRGMSSSYAWGIWGGWAFNLTDTAPDFAFAAPYPYGGLVEAGESLEWTVSVENATGTVSYQWQFGATQDAMADIPGQTSAAITLGPLEVADTGWYRCRAEDESGSVIYTPAIHVQVANQVPMAGLGALAAAGALVAGLAARRLRRTK